MIDIKKLDYTVVAANTLLRIINDPTIKSVTPYTDRNGLQCYNVLTMSGERYKVFTRGTVL